MKFIFISVKRALILQARFPTLQMPFVLNTSQLFLTYPQCNLSKEDMFTKLLEKFTSKNLTAELLLVAHELHKNGDHHLHVYCKLNGAFRSSLANCLDVGQYHGNYQGCRSAKNVLKYCTKAEDYVANFDVAPLLSKSQSRKEHLESVINRKRTLQELVKEHPQYLYGYTKLKLDIDCFFKDQADTRTTLPTWLPNPWGKLLSTKKACKKRHYWIYSDKPNLGKSFLFAKPIVREFRAAIRTGGEPYWNLRGDEQLIFIDEYNHATFRFWELNAMADGTFQFRLFQRGVIQLEDPLIVILSNLSISTLYPFMNNLLYERYLEIKLD